MRLWAYRHGECHDVSHRNVAVQGRVGWQSEGMGLTKLTNRIVPPQCGQAGGASVACLLGGSAGEAVSCGAGCAVPCAISERHRASLAARWPFAMKPKER